MSGIERATAIAARLPQRYVVSMVSDSIKYEIREQDIDDGVALELLVGGSSVARATARQEVLDDMDRVLGLDRTAVMQGLRDALYGVLTSKGLSVAIHDIQEDPQRPLRYFARYEYQLRDEVTTGVVWYDVSSSTTDPDDLPAVVRNKMRHEVHRLLTSPGSVARSLVDFDE